MTREQYLTRLERLDAQLHRCTCGSWLLGNRPCSCCAKLGGAR